MARVMVVDDNREMRTALKATLENAGHEVSEVGDGRDIVEIVRDGAPDVILLDVVMPEVDGFEALEKLRTDPATRDTAVIMVTARGHRTDLTKARRLGANDYIVKPWARGEIEARIARVLDT